MSPDGSGSGIVRPLLYYVAIAAEKLRAQGSVAGMIQVYIRTNPHKEDCPQYSKGLTIPLPEPSGDTLYLTRAAL
ncbi:MAG: hypothetical protein KJ702_15430, partial [Gammaproteobacteria bacterium]|nr:hypothetical protein [Gammaproteobacteria bacterium]